MQSEQQVNNAIEKYADMIKRICFYHLKNQADTEDVFQSVFLRYMLHDKPFFDEEHEKAWLIRVAINACKDQLKNFFRRNTVPLEQLNDIAVTISEDHRDVLEAVLTLPGKYKDVIYLHYYEGYTASEIGNLLGKKVNSVYSLLSRGRALLKERLESDGIGQ